MEFIRAEGDKGGKRFVGNNEEGISLRQSWKAFRNAFAAWFFDLDQDTVQEYLEKAAKESITEGDVYQYSWMTPKTVVSGVFYYLLTNQLVMAREPTNISEADIGYHGIEEAIERANSGAVEEDEGN